MSTADDFYSIMGVLAREMLEFGLMEPNKLIQVRNRRLPIEWIIQLNILVVSGYSKRRAS